MNKRKYWSKKELSRITIFLVITAFSMVGVTAEKGGHPTLSTSVIEPMNTLADMKDSLTPAQRKLSSQLILVLRQKHSDPRFSNLPKLQANVLLDADGTTLVDIKASVSSTLLVEIESLGGTIINSFPEYEAIRARMPLENIEALAANAEVRFIRPAVKAMLNKINASEGGRDE